MDFVRQLFSWIGSFIQAIINVLAQLILTLSGSMVDMTESQAQSIATLILGLIVFAWVARRTIWGGGFRIFRPMSITLHTTETPWQVLMNDLRSCLITILALIVLLVFLVSLAYGR